MSEYIDRKEFGKGMKCQSVEVLGETYIRLADLTSFIHSLPAADAEPVRHGRWIEELEIGYDGSSNGVHNRCSICSEWLYDTDDFNYCPNCGAKMDLEVSDG